LPFTRQQAINDNNITWEVSLDNELKSRGYDPADFDYNIIRSHSGQPFATGNAAGGNRILLFKSAAWIACHEIEHTLYFVTGFSGKILHHANLWKVSNSNNAIGPGNSLEYGNRFSVMGGGSRDSSLPHK